MRTNFFKKLLGLSIGVFLLLNAAAQTDEQLSSFKPEFRRATFHDNIDAAQQELINTGSKNGVFAPTADEDVNEMLRRVILKNIDIMQYRIETDTMLDTREKQNGLATLTNFLRGLRNKWRMNAIEAEAIPAIIQVYQTASEQKERSLLALIRPLSYEAGETVLLSRAFDNDKEIEQVKELLVFKQCVAHPSKIFNILSAYPDVSFADSLIAVAGKKYPNQLYDYSQSYNKLGQRIKNNKDPFVQMVSKISASKKGQVYFPFLDGLINGKYTLESIDDAMQDDLTYFRLLVKTRIEHMGRMLDKDTAFAHKELWQRIEQKSAEVFVNTINSLHDHGAAVRFKILQPLTAQELYYVAITTNGLIYTSSYTDGVYPLMMSRMRNRGDSLLYSVNFDHYRRFISQAAAYNTLSGFLKGFPRHDDATNLMTAFVSSLENSEGLEDGVDVADSYASIFENNKKLAEDILLLVQTNLQRNQQTGNAKGVTIYNILNKLFLSADPKNEVDLSKELGVPPVYNVPFSTLTNDKGEVISQVFFYGDSDGKGIFNGFLNMFAPANWTIDRANPQWVTIKSKVGKPVTIFANRPLDEETGEDDKAQQALNAYLEANNLKPTVTIHRGHSYFTNSTIEYMAPSSKIVFMGSCGGYNLINDILSKTDDAHIIASKQIGRTAINKPFFLLLTEKLRKGESIDWIPFWKEFEKNAKAPGFEDYIPPYKNLGAIFIKAYKLKLGDPDEESLASIN